MIMTDIARRGLVLLGCGRMGSALLQGWCDTGLPLDAVHVTDPAPSAWLEGMAAQGLHLNEPLPERPAIAVIAVKPQMIGDALPYLRDLGGGDTLFISIAAGTPIAVFESALGPASPIIRAMPNTPAAVRRGVTALIGNAAVTEPTIELAEYLLEAVGRTVRLESEAQMDAVTAVSGSGPAYVFHLIETLARAGQAEGLSRELALDLARQTVAGSGALAEQSGVDPAQLRINVTSPGGTTAAALDVLMDEETGFPDLMRRAVAAAARRSRELSK